MLDAKKHETADQLKRRGLQEQQQTRDEESHIHVYLDRDTPVMPQPVSSSYREVYAPARRFLPGRDNLTEGIKKLSAGITHVSELSNATGPTS